MKEAIKTIRTLESILAGLALSLFVTSCNPLLSSLTPTKAFEASTPQVGLTQLPTLERIIPSFTPLPSPEFKIEPITPSLVHTPIPSIIPSLLPTYTKTTVPNIPGVPNFSLMPKPRCMPQIDNKRKELLYNNTIYMGISSRKVVYLTFDDVNYYNYLQSEILRQLEAYNAKATFFVTGEQLDRDPDGSKAIVAGGNPLAYHGDNHVPMTTLTYNALEDDVCSFVGKLNRLLPGYVLVYVRPPYGNADYGVRSALANFGLIDVMWSNQTSGNSPDEVYNDFVKKLEPGQIWLMHMQNKNDVGSLKFILPYLIKEGYSIEAVSGIMR